MKRQEQHTMSVYDVQDYLGISLSGAYALVQSDGFPAFRVGNKRGRILITREAFERWLNAQQAKGAAL